MSDTLDDRLRDILYPHCHGCPRDDCLCGLIDDIPLLKQAFTDAGYVQMKPTGYEYTVDAKLKMGLMTGQAFFDRFQAEYHNKADWIAADPDMGADAEHDVLLCARLAANINETKENT